MYLVALELIKFTFIIPELQITNVDLAWNNSTLTVSTASSQKRFCSAGVYALEDAECIFDVYGVFLP